MARRGGLPDEERRKIFRRMEWVFVYAPPLLALLVALAGGAFLAWLVRFDDTTFWARWAVASLLLLAVPGIAFLIHAWWTKDN